MIGPLISLRVQTCNCADDDETFLNEAVRPEDLVYEKPFAIREGDVFHEEIAEASERQRTKLMDPA